MQRGRDEPHRAIGPGFTGSRGGHREGSSGQQQADKQSSDGEEELDWTARHCYGKEGETRAETRELSGCGENSGATFYRHPAL